MQEGNIPSQHLCEILTIVWEELYIYLQKLNHLTDLKPSLGCKKEMHNRNDEMFPNISLKEMSNSWSFSKCIMSWWGIWVFNELFLKIIYYSQYVLFKRG
jgi:hypothetical protein